MTTIKKPPLIEGAETLVRLVEKPEKLLNFLTEMTGSLHRHLVLKPVPWHQDRLYVLIEMIDEIAVRWFEERVDPIIYISDGLGDLALTCGYDAIMQCLESVMDMLSEDSEDHSRHFMYIHALYNVSHSIYLHEQEKLLHVN